MNEETPNPQLMTLLEKYLHEGTKNLYHGIFSILLSCTTVLEFYKENITES